MRLICRRFAVYHASVPRTYPGLAIVSGPLANVNGPLAIVSGLEWHGGLGVQVEGAATGGLSAGGWLVWWLVLGG